MLIRPPRGWRLGLATVLACVAGPAFYLAVLPPQQEALGPTTAFSPSAIATTRTLQIIGPLTLERPGRYAVRTVGRTRPWAIQLEVGALDDWIAPLRGQTVTLTLRPAPPCRTAILRGVLEGRETTWALVRPLGTDDLRLTIWRDGLAATLLPAWRGQDVELSISTCPRQDGPP